MSLGEAPEQAQGLSAGVLGRLKAQRAEDDRGWTARSLADKQYVYRWADGIYTTLREDDDPRLCLPVVGWGRIHPVTLRDGADRKQDRAAAQGERLTRWCRAKLSASFASCQRRQLFG